VQAAQTPALHTSVKQSPFAPHAFPVAQLGEQAPHLPPVQTSPAAHGVGPVQHT
jgi:hypothetical protein